MQSENPSRARYVGGKPFYGESGKPNRKATARLNARRNAYDANSKSPGGHQMHRPGSLTK